MSKLPVYVKVIVILFGITNFLFLLYVGRAFLIPLAIAFLLSLLLLPVCRWLEKWKLPRLLSVTICLLLIIALLGGAIVLIVNQFLQFGTEIPAIAEKLAMHSEKVQVYIEDTFDISSKNQLDYVNDLLQNALQSGGAVLSATASNTLGFLMSAFLISLYFFFFMYYRTFFRKNNLHGFCPQTARNSKNNNSTYRKRNPELYCRNLYSSHYSGCTQYDRLAADWH